MSNFTYSRDWYEQTYHAAKPGCDDVARNKGEHWERDLACVRGMSILPEHRVLVCGCGGGNNLALLEEHLPGVKNVSAFDFAAASTDFCRARFPAATFTTCCISALPYPPRSFDRILLFDVTEHLPLPLMVAGLFELYRVTADDGIIGVLPGMTVREEHINLMTPMQIAWWLIKAGYLVQPHPLWVYGKRGLRAEHGREF